MPRAVLSEQGVGVRSIVVREPDCVAGSERCTCEQAAMAMLVHDDQILGADECGNHADVGQVAAAEHHSVFAALEIREALLQRCVERMVTRDVP